MRRKKNVTKKINPPSRTSEGMEKQMTNLAVQMAKKQLENGTASSQTLSHYLKLATEQSKLETEILKLKKDLIVAQTEQLKSQKNIEKLYGEALNAMRQYGGQEVPDAEDISGDDEI